VGWGTSPPRRSVLHEQYRERPPPPPHRQRSDQVAAVEGVRRETRDVVAPRHLRCLGEVAPQHLEVIEQCIFRLVLAGAHRVVHLRVVRVKIMGLIIVRAG
jgi:hypothetical protein